MSSYEKENNATRRYNNCNYSPNTSKEICQTNPTDIDKNVVTIRDFNTSLSSMHRLPRCRINKVILDLYHTISQMDGLNRHLQKISSNSTINKFLSSGHGTFSKAHHMTEYKTVLSKHIRRLKSYQIFFHTTKV